MRNRQIIDLPATLSDSSGIANRLAADPCDLNLHEVTYLHFHREFELGMCVAGEGVLHHGDTEQPFCVGDVQLIYPYMRHIHKTSESARCQWVWIYVNAEKLFCELGVADFSRLDALIRRTSVLSGLADRENTPELYERLRNFTEKSANEGYPDGEHMALDFYGILLSAADALPKDCEEGKNLVRISALDGALRRIAQDIENGSSTDIEQLARLCSMSVSGFRRKFSELMGAPPKVYIQACRIRRAKQLLREGKMNILDIAFSVGYKDISGFNRSFMEITGETPSAYRKRHR